MVTIVNSPACNCGSAPLTSVFGLIIDLSRMQGLGAAPLAGFLNSDMSL
jgi:hypothetical protein